MPSRSRPVAAGLMASFWGGVADTFRPDADLGVLGIGPRGVTVAHFGSPVLWGNLGNALSFAVLVAVAVILRRRPQAHKRLVLLASISIVRPALARIARCPIFGGEQGPFAPTVFWQLEPSLAIGIVGHFIVRNALVWISGTDVGLSLVYALQ